MSTEPELPAVGTFTDTYLPTVNGVSYTISTWRDRWLRQNGRMDVIYPGATEYSPAEGEYPVSSFPFPFYEDFRLGVPSIPRPVRSVDLLHIHTPFSIGFAGLRLARRQDLPTVATYHTPTSEYTDYLAPTDRIAKSLTSISRRWERWIFDRVDLVLAPSESTLRHLIDDVGIDSPVRVLSNGVDIEHFRPVDPESFLSTHGITSSQPLVGYTGRHGYEKQLDELIDAASDLDVTLVLGGDGPARSDLQELADRHDVDAYFLGFLPRSELPAFYSALDLFAFPSPVETQGIVAMEAMACGTPVVGTNRGALRDTIDEGDVGYQYESGDIGDFETAIKRGLTDCDSLSAHCLDRRESMAVARTIEALQEIYRSVLSETGAH